VRMERCRMAYAAGRVGAAAFGSSSALTRLTGPPAAWPAE
jgi:hypothetical protein